MNKVRSRFSIFGINTARQQELRGKNSINTERMCEKIIKRIGGEGIINGIGVKYAAPVTLGLLMVIVGIIALNMHATQLLISKLETELSTAKEVNIILQEENNMQAEKLNQKQEDFAKELSELEAELERVTRLKGVLERRDAYATEKIIYLTFDDGPSVNVTNEILDVLEDYGIKATFFVIGSRCHTHPEVLQRIHAAGHAIGNHTYSHDYKSIYRNLDTFVRDFQTAQEAIFSITGEYPTLYRYAGGSLTARNYAGRLARAQFDQYLWEQGVQFFDWNIDSWDAKGGKVTVDSITKQAIMQLRNRQRAIILMHDFKYRHSTAQALPTIIETLLERGYEFSVLSATGYTVQH